MILVGNDALAMIIYLLVGISAVYLLLGGCCKDCANGKCTKHGGSPNQSM